MVRLFTRKSSAIRYAQKRQVEGRDVALFYSHRIPLWERRDCLEVSESSRRIGTDGENIDPTSPARQRPAEDLDHGDDPHPARR